MQQMFLLPHGVRKTYLNIDSTMDTQWETATHNPANFELKLPNAIRTNKIWKITPHTLIVPRMFPNIYAPDNQLVWYQRQVTETPYGTVPNQYLRSVSPTWTPTLALTLPPGMYNTDTIVAAINAVTGANEVWAFDSTSNCFIVTKTPTGSPVAFGLFINPSWVPPPVTYANMTYVVEVSGSHLFDPLGLEKEASALSALFLSPSLNPQDPNTFDNIEGSNLNGMNCFPLFDRTLHSYASWASTPYTSAPSNQPNLAGPVAVHCIVTDLGDSSTVDAQTGTVQDIVTTINLGDVDFGTFKERIVHDVDGASVEFQQARNISNFRVQLLDSRNRQLMLPRNFPVFLRLQLIHSQD